MTFNNYESINVTLNNIQTSENSIKLFNEDFLKNSNIKNIRLNLELDLDEFKVKISPKTKEKFIKETELVKKYGQGEYNFITEGLLKNKYGDIFIRPLFYHYLNEEKTEILGTTLDMFAIKINYFLYDKKNNRKLYFETDKDKKRIYLQLDLEDIENVDLNNNFYFDFELTQIFESVDNEVKERYYLFFPSNNAFVDELNNQYSLQFDKFLNIVVKNDQNYDPNNYDETKCRYNRWSKKFYCEKYNNLLKVKNEVNKPLFKDTYTYERILELVKQDYILTFNIKNQNNTIHYEEKERIEEKLEE